MSMKLEDEDYWNESETTGFSFDDDEGVSASSLFESAKVTGSGRPPERPFVRSNVFSDLIEPLSGTKPLETLVSKRSLALSEEVARKGPKDPSEELSLLKKQIASQWEAPPAAATVRAIMLGKPFSLHLYRSLESKSQLLDEAVKSRDGNAILCVVLFLNRTLKKKLFCRLLQFKPTAVPVYINYLSIRFEVKAVCDLLLMLGQIRDAALKEFNFLIQPHQNLDKRLQNLKVLVRDHFSSPDAEDRQFVENMMKFVDWQVSNAGGVSALSGTVADALSHVCTNHWSEVRGHPLSPLTLTAMLGVSERIFHWKAITARSSVQGWDDISALAVTKGWLGAKKLKTVVSAERIVVELHRQNAPEHVISEYFALVESGEKQLALARKLAWHRAAIDTLVSMRDRLGLVQYQAALNPQSNDYLHAETALRLNVKWKN